ncbi:MAG: hypothetical protein L3K05_05205, partial [Thermoplasmata archaeon]|nr:hypothetical protein [Thermoplasmata archaeon]
RIWLLLIPAIAGPIGSTLADLYLRVPSPATAQVLGLLITAGLASLVLLDLTALAVGEDLALRTHYFTFALPQSRAAALAGRLTIAVGGSLAVFGVGVILVLALASELVASLPGAVPAILVPAHLAAGLFGLLLFLGGVTSAAGFLTRSSSQALVAGVLAGVVVAGLASLFLLEGRLTPTFPEALAAGGLIGLTWTVVQFQRADG